MVLKPCVLISWECPSSPGQLSLPFIPNTFAAQYHLKCFPVELVAVCMYLKLIFLSVLAQMADVQHYEVLALIARGPLTVLDMYSTPGPAQLSSMVWGALLGDIL